MRERNEWNTFCVRRAFVMQKEDETKYVKLFHSFCLSFVDLRVAHDDDIVTHFTCTFLSKSFWLRVTGERKWKRFCSQWMWSVICRSLFISSETQKKEKLTQQQTCNLNNNFCHHCFLFARFRRSSKHSSSSSSRLLFIFFSFVVLLSLFCDCLTMLCTEMS